MTEAPLIVLKGLDGNEPPTLGPIQEWILSVYPFVQAAWWAVMFVVSLTVIALVIRAYLRERR